MVHVFLKRAYLFNAVTSTQTDFGPICNVKVVVCGSLAEAVAENKLEEDAPGNWNDAKRTDAITSGWLTGLSKEVIQTFPSSLLRQK